LLFRRGERIIILRDQLKNNGIHIGPTFLDSPTLSRRAVGIGAEAIGPIVFSHSYDSNGNLTSNPDAGLTGMTYNALNLLSGYTDSATGKQTSLGYTASGEKFGVSTLNGQIISKHWNRFGNVVYDNSFSPTHLLVDGGYVDLTGALSNATYAYCFYVQDHQGNNRMVTDANGTVLQVNHYDPYGQLLTPISSTTAVSQYKYGGKEWSGTTLSYDFGARNYLPALPRWSTMDPLAEKYYSVSPYVYCAGNPVNLVDEGGRRPIYSREGILLGTDDDGLQGDAIIMDAQSYHPGIRPDEALKYNLGIQGLMDIDAVTRFEKSFNSLSSRPDWDGYLTLVEANEWYRNGNGKPLFVNLDKIDLSGLVSLGERYVMKEKVISLFWSSNSFNDAFVYGKIKLKRYPNHMVRSYADTYDFDMKPWLNPGNWGRNVATAIGKRLAGEGAAYQINFYGSKRLAPIVPWVK